MIRIMTFLNGGPYCVTLSLKSVSYFLSADYLVIFSHTCLSQILIATDLHETFKEINDGQKAFAFRGVKI